MQGGRAAQAPARRLGNQGDHERGNHEREHRDRGNAYGSYYLPFYYPTLDYGSSYYNAGSPYGDPGPNVAVDPATQNMVEQQNMLGEQIDRLTATVEELSASREPAPVMTRTEPPPPTPPVTVILRDGRRFQSASYAVMNGVFWDFSKDTPRRTPLENVDVTASVKATEDSGAEFPDLNAGH